MKNILALIQILISTVLIILILLQAKGTGLGNVFGGGGETFRSKRGMEKILYSFTLVLCVLFLISSLLGVIIK